MYGDIQLKEIKDAINRVLEEGPEKWPNGFDFPDYGGLHQAIAYRLTPGQVDKIQDEIYEGRPILHSGNEVKIILYGDI
jgi:hypothetical protein